MKVSQKKWTQQTGWVVLRSEFAEKPQLVLIFGARTLLSDATHFDKIHAMYPEAHILSASTAGEICSDEVLDNSLIVTAVYFEKTTLQFAKESITDPEQSLEVGKKLASALPHEGLTHVMVFSDGLKVNGTPLVQGLGEVLPPNVSVTGGLVGDGSDFKLTLVGLDEAPAEGRVIVLGFYGNSLKVGYGSLGGWDPFGPQRTITKAKNNVLYELDGKNALTLYKEYLGELAKELPASGLLFPLSLSVTDKSGKQVQVVRTLLNIDETEQSMIFAGDMPEGIKAQLMKANFERLIDGAQQAASMSIESLVGAKPDLAILISCIGRKLVLKERTVEEIEAVRSIVGEQTVLAGFYSYGEICPTAATEKQCQLHNQTMTITTFKEV
ncbi:MAG: FIST N-terminal domain-containing protein [Patescibacteria group bacterium]